MNLRETKEILARVAAVDSRELSEAMADAWHDIIGHVDYRVAVRALILAQRDPQVKWVQPKDIMAKVVDATHELNREHNHSNGIPDHWKSEDQPLCKEHRTAISDCVDCRGVLSWRSHQFPREDLHAWAVKNLYLSEVATV